MPCPKSMGVMTWYIGVLMDLIPLFPEILGYVSKIYLDEG